MFPNKHLKNSRLPRTLLVMNYAITLKEEDSFFYCEYHDLKKYLTRKERLQLVRNIINAKHYLITEDNPKISSVEMI